MFASLGISYSTLCGFSISYRESLIEGNTEQNYQKNEITYNFSQLN